MGETAETCIRCGDAPAVDDFGYCGQCHWATRAEVEQGLSALREYLKAWARWRVYEAEHPAEGSAPAP